MPLALALQKQQTPPDDPHCNTPHPTNLSHDLTQVCLVPPTHKLKTMSLLNKLLLLILTVGMMLLSSRQAASLRSY